jgi:hypothetical protein
MQVSALLALNSDVETPSPQGVAYQSRELRAVAALAATVGGSALRCLHGHVGDRKLNVADAAAYFDQDFGLE